ncbi:glycoside hydrolase superfamily [Microdochium bolleyi]|uniref:Glycoside hydrolase superfamily n=1 Tax=Microdochium bolleyi TaxID=196109 RepID=A0A136JKH4_9PEZI|nr:glycoside hydrolase superfamily [Microdochium bolleyi]
MVTHHNIPHLVTTDAGKQLIVKGSPFLILGGELQNSSLTDPEYMNTVWQKLVDTNVNTVLGCVTWEQIEPEEGKFCFEVLDQVVQDARRHGLHLVLLWFGSFKNGLSTYAPAWVKTNPKRFPRMKLRKAGGVLETADVISLFSDECRDADARAFRQFMGHLKTLDEAHSTVIMVQVENEPGLLGDSRDGGDIANAAFSEVVPHELVSFFADSYDSLLPEAQKNLAHFVENNRSAEGKEGKTWVETFGPGPKTDEIFMAYHYARYINSVAEAGKAAYNLPMYVNVWMNYVGDNADNDFPVVAGGGGKPGDYPSGGCVPDVLDIWQRFCPKLDFFSPDIYLNNYGDACGQYRHRGQPLFIPEQRRDEYGARRIWVAYGSHAALGVSPFGIDTLEPSTNPFTRHYALLDSVSAHVLEAQRRPCSSVGFFFDELTPSGKETAEPIVRHWAGFELTIKRAFVFGRPGPGAGMVIHKGDGKFLLVGWGFLVSARSLDPRATFTGILKFEEKTVVDRSTGELRTARMLNGDETRSGQFAQMPNEDPDYGGFPICVTIPARTMIAELQFYCIKE